MPLKVRKIKANIKMILYYYNIITFYNTIKQYPTTIKQFIRQTNFQSQYILFVSFSKQIILKGTIGPPNVLNMSLLKMF